MTSETIYIRSAVELTKDLKTTIESKLKSKYPNTANFEYQLDSSILAGLVIQIQDMEYHFDLRDEIDYILMELVK